MTDRLQLYDVFGALVPGVLVFGAVLLVLAKRATDPLRTALPDRSTPVSSFLPKLDKLKANDRMYVIGYLLLQRGEISSVSTAGMNSWKKKLSKGRRPSFEST